MVVSGNPKTRFRAQAVCRAEYRFVDALMPDVDPFRLYSKMNDRLLKVLINCHHGIGCSENIQHATATAVPASD